VLEELRSLLLAGMETAAAEDIAADHRIGELEVDIHQLDPSNSVVAGIRLVGDTGGCCTGRS